MRFGGQMLKGLMPMACAAALTGGCTAIHDHRGFLIDQALLDSVQPGIDNRLSVERTLGRPTFTSQFGEPSWYYIAIDTRQLPFGPPHTTRQTVLRVRFDPKGNVLAIDKAGMDRVVRLSPDHMITPTRGRNRSLLQDLFGNIGSVGAGGVGGAGGGAPGGGSGGPGTGPNGS